MKLFHRKKKINRSYPRIPSIIHLEKHALENEISLGQAELTLMKEVDKILKKKRDPYVA